MKIALDAMGGDLGPKAAVEGAVLAARDFGIEVVMVGDAKVLEAELRAHKAGKLPVRIENAPEAILMDESPVEAVFAKPHSSIHVGLELVKRGDANAFISAGNSGAVMAASMAVLGNLAGVDRPAIASLVPSSGGHALLIDAGANLDVKPLNLVQFAVMGSVYWRHVRNVSRPRVGILSNGEEASKGTDLTRAAAAMLAQMPTYVNYIGYVEGRDVNHGKADVVVTDGFTGNVTLKTMEGFASFMSGNLREIFKTNLRTKFAYLLVRKKLDAMRARLDPHEYGGAPLLGTTGIAIIAHGSSNAHAIRNAIRAAANEALVHRVNAEILEIIAKIQPAIPGKPPAAKGFRALFAKMRDRLQRHPKDKEHRDKEHEAGKPRESHPVTLPITAISESPSPPPREPSAVAAPEAQSAKKDAGQAAVPASPKKAAPRESWQIGAGTDKSVPRPEFVSGIAAVQQASSNGSASAPAETAAESPSPAPAPSSAAPPDDAKPKS
jgi:phosphate acyltransferase